MMFTPLRANFHLPQGYLFMYYVNECDPLLTITTNFQDNLICLPPDEILGKIFILYKHYAANRFHTVKYKFGEVENYFLFAQGVASTYVDDETGLSVCPDPAVNKRATIQGLEGLTDGMGLEFDRKKVGNAR